MTNLVTIEQATSLLNENWSANQKCEIDQRVAMAELHFHFQCLKGLSSMLYIDVNQMIRMFLSVEAINIAFNDRVRKSKNNRHKSCPKYNES